MSLMGYTDTDVVHMLASIRLASNNLPTDSLNREVILKGLEQAYDFLDALLMEGRV